MMRVEMAERAERAERCGIWGGDGGDEVSCGHLKNILRHWDGARYTALKLSRQAEYGEVWVAYGGVC